MVMAHIAHFRGRKTLPRKLLKDTCQLAAEILEGKHDKDLDWIVAAAAARNKNRFRPGVTVRLTGTRNPTLDGLTGTVIKMNPKRATVGIGPVGQFGTYEREYNVPPSMLEIIER